MKIFCIGEAKTGTKSLRTALKKLGFTTKHSSKQFSRSYKKGDYLLKEHIDQVDAFLDGSFRMHFKELDEEYGKNNARFIYTDRDPKKWIVSLANHNWRRGRRRESEKEIMLNSLKKFSILRKNILLYFKDNPRFLLIDVTDKSINKWNTLINFLNLNIDFDITRGFPHQGGAKRIYHSLEDLKAEFDFTESDFLNAISEYERNY